MSPRSVRPAPARQPRSPAAPGCTYRSRLGSLGPMGAIHAVTSWLGRCIDPVTGNPRDAGPGRFDAGNPKAVDQARDRLNELKMSAQKGKDPLRVRDAAAARAAEAAAQPKTLRVVRKPIWSNAPRCGATGGPTTGAVVS